MITDSNESAALPSSRQEAISSGAERYFTGRPCKNGHLSERSTKWKACCECSRIAAAAWAARNPERSADICRKYYSANVSAVAERHKEWRGKNRPLCKAGEHKRRARKLNAIPSWTCEFDSFAIAQAGELAALRRAATGFDWHIDHMIPLQAREACGLHIGVNLQVIPQTLNARKKNRMIFTRPGEWIGLI